MNKLDPVTFFAGNRIPAMFYFFGVGLNLFLLLLLISKRGKSSADKILLAWLTVIACHLGLYLISLQPLTDNNLHLLGVAIPFPFLHGPFLYLYTAAITNMLPARKKVLALHFLPALAIVIYLVPIFLMTTQQKRAIYLTEGRDYDTFFLIEGLLMQLSGLVYVTWSFIILRKHRKNIGEQFSYEESINLNWLRYLIYGLLVVWIVIIFVGMDTFIFGSAVLFVILIGFFGIKQVGIFNSVHPPTPALPEMYVVDFITETNSGKNEKVAIAEPNVHVILPFINDGEADDTIKKTVPEEISIKKGKYAKSGLSSEAAEELHKRLIELMETAKLFKEPELTLSDLAVQLNIHPNYLSQVINDFKAVNFYDYINSLRVEEFKMMLSNPENKNYTLMSLAYDCGFNSKSAFNRVFKKFTNMSPSEYFKTINK